MKLCFICGAAGTSKHHLFPKGAWPVRDRTWKSCNVWLCEPCHRKVHRKASNEDLATRYNTKEKLKNLIPPPL